ncbi:MAG: hypothetical protein ABSF52_04695 [Syntrophobacteraceae bacterium]|jgi:hypothetical protein
MAGTFQSEFYGCDEGGGSAMSPVWGPNRKSMLEGLGHDEQGSRAGTIESQGANRVTGKGELPGHKDGHSA